MLAWFCFSWHWPKCFSLLIDFWFQLGVFWGAVYCLIYFHFYWRGNISAKGIQLHPIGHTTCISTSKTWGRAVCRSRGGLLLPKWASKRGLSGHWHARVPWPLGDLFLQLGCFWRLADRVYPKSDKHPITCSRVESVCGQQKGMVNGALWKIHKELSTSFAWN